MCFLYFKLLELRIDSKMNYNNYNSLTKYSTDQLSTNVLIENLGLDPQLSSLIPRTRVFMLNSYKLLATSIN